MKNLLRLILAVTLFLPTLAAHAQKVIAWGDNAKGQTNVPPSATEVAAVAAGYFHSLALRADGTVVAWGSDDYGQTEVPPAATNVLAIAAAGNHSLALRADGTVLAWGETNFQYYPSCNLNAIPAAATNVIAIATGDHHSLALRSDGTVVAWGLGSYGACAVPSGLQNVVGIWAGMDFSVAMQANGCVVVWGSHAASTLSGGGALPRTLTNVVSLAAGFQYNLALLADGTVGAWGGPGGPSRSLVSIPASATNVVAIAASTAVPTLPTYPWTYPYYCRFALCGDGSLVAWGTGLATNLPPSAINLSAIAAGSGHGVAIQGDGSPRFAGNLICRQQFAAGDPLPLYARAVSSAPLLYYWRTNGTPAGVSQSPFLTPVASLDNPNPTYQVVVSNALGSATSTVAQLVVRSVSIWGDNRNWQRAIPPEVVNPVAVAAGAYHGLALNPDGSVSAWGKNVDGQASVPASATGITAVAAGGDHSLALKADGSLVAWGRNWDGQTNVPPSATNLVAIAAGYAHSLALRTDGTVLAWGNNDYGQTNVPAQATAVVAIAAGYYHSLALRADGTVLAWGLDGTGSPLATNVVAIAGGWWHSLALRADGSVIAWGDDSYGQCEVPPALTQVVGIAAGYYHSLALRADGTVMAWGKDYCGVTEVPTGLRDVAAIAAGHDYSLALAGSGPPRLTQLPASAVAHVGGGALFSASVQGTHPLAVQWLHGGAPLAGATTLDLRLPQVQPGDAGEYTLLASNSAGQTNSPAATLQVQASPALAGVTQFRHVLPGQTLCLTASICGAEPLRCQWQFNGLNLANNSRLSGVTSPTLVLNPAQAEDSGSYSLVVSNAAGVVTGLVARVSVSPLLGWGDDSAGQTELPIGLANAVTVAAGGDHSLALRTDGTLSPWGDNSTGQNSVPFAGTNIVAIADGESHSLALRVDGTVLAWGDNSYGQAQVPAAVSQAIAIAAGSRHSLALLANGTLVTWGCSLYGLSPVPTSASNVVAIAAGEDFSAALRADGNIVCWGNFPRVGPTSNGGVVASNAVALAVGAKHLLALRANGSVLAWGRDYYGQCSVPPSATNVVAIAAGGEHSLAVMANGSVIAWGADYSGQSAVPPAVTNVVSVGAGGAHSLALVGAGGQGPALQLLATAATLGQATTLSAGLLAGGAVTYQWQLNGVDLAGATNPWLSFAAVNWTNAGIYRLVVSNSFGRVSGASIVLTVLRTPLQFDSAGLALEATNGFRLRLLGASGAGPIVIYASTNLTAWEPILTNPPVIGPLELVDPQALSWNHRFYRAVELDPNTDGVKEALEKVK